MLSYLGITSNYLAILAIDLILGVALLMAMRATMGVLTNVNSVAELSEEDNPAFGITLAGGVFGMGILLSGVLAGDAQGSALDEALAVIAYGVAGLAMVALAHTVFDRISLASFSVRDELKARNTAVALTDASNTIATAIIVRGVIVWVEGGGAMVAIMGFAGFVVSQILLSLVSYYRIQLFSRAGEGKLVDGIRDGNMAIAMRFGGYRIGAALVISAALGLVPFDASAPTTVFAYWAVAAVVGLIVLAILVVVAEMVLLARIDTRDEVDRQANIAVGAVQAALYVALGLAIMTVTA